LAHLHSIAGHEVAASDDRVHTGQVYVWQQVFGSTPVGIGICPFGHNTASVGHATGFMGSQVGFGGTHWPTHVTPLHAPLASHMQLLSLRSQPQAGGVGGTSLPLASVVVVVGVPPPLLPMPPGAHDHSLH